MNAALARRGVRARADARQGVPRRRAVRGRAERAVRLAPRARGGERAGARGGRDGEGGALRAWSPSRRASAGFTITTSIDPTLQAAARKAVRDGARARTTSGTACRVPLKAAAAGREQEGQGARRRATRSPRSTGHPSSSSTRCSSASSRSPTTRRGRSTCASAPCSAPVKLADYERYNPRRPRAERVRPGRRARAREPPRRTGRRTQKVPLRLESGPEGALVVDRRAHAADPRARGQLRGAGRRARPGDPVAPPARVDVQADRLLVRAALAPLHPRDARRPHAGRLRRRLPAARTSRAGRGTTRCGCARRSRNSVNVAAVRVLQDVGPANVVAVGAGPRDRVADEAGPVARARQLRGPADRARRRLRHVRRRRHVRGAAPSSRASSDPTARTFRSRSPPPRAACSTMPRRTSSRACSRASSITARRRARRRSGRPLAGKTGHVERPEGHMVRRLLARPRGGRLGRLRRRPRRWAAPSRAR